MTKKDYILIADAIRTSNKCISRVNGANENADEIVEEIVQALCFNLSSNNPRFDMRKFCAYIYIK